MKTKDNGNVRFFSVSRMEHVQAVIGTHVTNAFPRHVHSTFCIGIVDQGGRIISHRGTLTVILKGDLFVINPGESHTCKSFDKEGQSYRIVCVDIDLMRSIASEISAKVHALPYFRSALLSDKQLVQEIDQFFYPKRRPA